MQTLLGLIVLAAVFPFSMYLLALVLSNPLLAVVAVPAGLYVSYR